SKPVSYSAIFEVFPEVKPKLSRWTSYEKTEITLDDADIDLAIDDISERYCHWHKVEREAKDKDQVIIDFEGGIRCEKASSLLKARGFHNVHHLKGGILSYMDQINESESLWEGECFVFDDRVALNHKLEVGSFDMCHGCRMPITESDKLSEQFQKGISCPNCFDKKTPEQKKRYAERIKQIDLAKQRNENYHGAKSS
ncbi:hypothetical protein N9H72_03360, partial [Gammaproteobacteria bacterium]|nr:hypothetical protein [Gammaproteobacteria bacterium]